MADFMEFKGGNEDLVEATFLVLEDHHVDLAIVRDVVDPDFCSEVNKWGNEGRYLYHSIPALVEVDKLVFDWWSRNGYQDHAINPKIQLGGAIPANASSRTHLDDMWRYGPKQAYPGGVSLSIAGGTSGESYAKFYAKRLRRDFTTPSGQFDIKGYDKKIARYDNIVRHLAAKLLSHFPIEVEQYPGDVVIFSQLPNPTIHRVISKNGRRARILDYPISPYVELAMAA